MKARIVRIGNSQGIRLPKPLIEAAGLGDEVDLKVRDGAIVIAKARNPREGWAEAAAQMRARGESKLLLGGGNRFDQAEWEW